MKLPWPEIILAILTNSAFTAVLLAAAAFIGRSIIGRWISRNIEEYKAQLQAANAREIERLRTELKIVSFEHETRFARLHEKRAEVTAELYKLLVRSEDSLMSLALAVGHTDFEGEIAQKTYETSQAAIQYLNEHCIYLPGNLANTVGDLTSKFISLRYHFQELDATAQYEVEHGEPQSPPPERDKALEKFFKAVSPLKKAIEDEFRKMLGDAG